MDKAHQHHQRCVLINLCLGSTHHPPEVNILVVRQDHNDICRFGSFRAPDAAGEQGGQREDRRSAPRTRHHAAAGAPSEKLGYGSCGGRRARRGRKARWTKHAVRSKFEEVESWWSYDQEEGGGTHSGGSADKIKIIIMKKNRNEFF